ncbi:hypothetical protein DRP77_07140 [Candidatus Poribacteria bacterium]|nr:MAG: hypothetical protein DRP77_07140 [Candidatus Poribacteria bacterium]
MRTSDIPEEVFNRAIREIVHEINDILGVIRSMAQFLQGNEGLGESVKEGLKLIEETAEEGIAFAKRLRRIVPVLSTEPREVDLKELLGEAAEEIRAKHGRDVELRLIVGDRELKAIGDPEGLKLAFEEILMNGVEAMPQGGRIEIRAEAEGGEVLIDFADEGEGISDEVKARAFEPFFTTKQGRLGIGLNVARGVARAHGGDLELESEPGKGTRVRIVLPRESS